MIQNVNMLNFLKKLEKDEHISNYLFVYYGKMNNDIIVSSIQMLVEKLKMEGYDKSFISKTKMLAIEVLQNIIHHQVEHAEIFPYFIVGTGQKQLKMVAGNVISASNKDSLLQKLNHLCALDKQLLEKDYKFALKQNKLTASGNAGLGLLDIVYRSNKNVSYQIQDIDKQNSTFNLNVLIN